MSMISDKAASAGGGAATGWLQGPGLPLGLILLVALLVRVPGLGAESFWTDEFFSLVESNGYTIVIWPPPGPATMEALRHTRLEDARPIWAIPGAMRYDTHPPIYFVLLRLWREAFGDGEAAVRSISVAASLLSILLLFDAVRVLSGTTAALWAATLLALASPAVYFAREVRSYALLILLLLIAASALARLERYGPSRIWTTVLGLAAAGAFLTHYYAVGYLAGLFVHAVLRLQGRARFQAIGAFLAAALVVVVTWGPMLIAQSAVVLPTSAWNLGRPGGWPELVVRLLGLPVTMLFTTTQTIPAGPAWLGLAWFGVAVIVWRRPAFRIFAWGAAGAIALVFLVDLLRDSRQLDFPRYLLAATPAVCALCASLASPPSRLRHAALVVLAAGLAASLPRAYTPSRPAWRDFVSRVNELAPPSQLLVLWGGYESSSTGLMALGTYSQPVERHLFVVPSQPTDADIAALRKAGEFFVLGSEEMDPNLLLIEKWDCLLCRDGFPFLWHVSP
jgi:4-amino-4-deoxy-L-arabinose transferase-like glycosyltransferase